jgi:CDP-glycerol glycerophosphotransferase (TagB/SpsB family)
MTEFLRSLMRMLHRIAPRFNHAVVWGWPDGEDSVIALEQALQKSCVRKVVMLVSEPGKPLSWQTGAKTIRVRKNTPAGFLWFFLARYVFFTHPCFTRDFPPDVVSVNVWHGMPVKRIGWMLEGDEGIACSHTLATSPFWAEIMERAMNPRGMVLPIGLPRNDRLFSNRSGVFGKLGLPDELKLLAWLPTYRRSVRGLPRADGTEAGNVFEMPDVDPEELNGFLTSRNAVLLVKPHPMAASDSSRAWSNLLIVDDAWLRERRLSLYELLGATNLLISDVSSVVIDYLLLDRPVIHAFSDRRAYESSRGFSVEPIDAFFAGPVVNDSHELLDALDRALSGDDPESGKRRKLLELSHNHRDGGATRRLLEALDI